MTTTRLKAVLAVLLVILVLLGSVAIYQQEQISSLKSQLETSTVKIGGVSYWEMVFPVLVQNGTSVVFHGVTFTLVSPSFGNSYSDPAKYIFAGSVKLSNGTLLNLTGRTVEIQLHMESPYGPNQPTVIVSFPVGEREFYDRFNVTAVNIPADMNISYEHVLLNVTYASLVAAPWFTKHVGPQAGVLWDYRSNLMTFYVSTA